VYDAPLDAEVLGAVIVVVQIYSLALNAHSFFAAVSSGTVVVTVDTVGTVFDRVVITDGVAVDAGTGIIGAFVVVTA
jgi:hypothetical protein